MLAKRDRGCPDSNGDIELIVALGILISKEVPDSILHTEFGHLLRLLLSGPHHHLPAYSC